MSSHCIEITDANFEAEVAKSPLPVLIDFWAVWCGPCRAVAPHFESLAQDYAGRVRFGKCDVDANQEIAARYDVRGVPMFLAFSGGKVVAQSWARRRAQSWKSWRRRRWPRRRRATSTRDDGLERHDPRAAIEPPAMMPARPSPDCRRRPMGDDRRAGAAPRQPENAGADRHGQHVAEAQREAQAQRRARQGEATAGSTGSRYRTTRPSAAPIAIAMRACGANVLKPRVRS